VDIFSSVTAAQLVAGKNRVCVVKSFLASECAGFFFWFSEKVMGYIVGGFCETLVFEIIFLLRYKGGNQIFIF
jgi:hypothetical protein